MEFFQSNQNKNTFIIPDKGAKTSRPIFYRSSKNYFKFGSSLFFGLGFLTFHQGV